MKKLFQKILVVGLFALTQVAFMAAANAGSFLRCKGDVIPTSDPTILVSAYASNEAGETVAVVTTSFLADGRLKHVIDSLVDDSYLMATAAPDINHSVSLDDARASFPEELKGLKNDKDHTYQVMFLAANRGAADGKATEWATSDDPDTLLGGACRIEVRCAFLIENGRIVKCLGCPYYIEKCN